MKIKRAYMLMIFTLLMSCSWTRANLVTAQPFPNCIYEFNSSNVQREMQGSYNSRNSTFIVTLGNRYNRLNSSDFNNFVQILRQRINEGCRSEIIDRRITTVDIRNRNHRRVIRY